MKGFGPVDSIDLVTNPLEVPAARVAELEALGYLDGSTAPTDED